MALQPIGPQSSVNERLVALEIVRQVLVLRFSLRLTKIMVDALNNTEQPIASMIRESLRAEAGLRSPEQVRKLDALIVQINAMRQPAWQAGRLKVEQELTALADVEPEEQRDLFGFLLPGIALAVPAVGIGLAAAAAPFQGRTARQWLLDAAESDAKRIGQAIYNGAASGDTPAQVARLIVGTANNAGRDGATQISRNHIDSIMRSASVHFSAYARDQFYRANEGSRYAPLPPGMLARPAVRAVGGAEDVVANEARRQVAQVLAALDMAAGGAGQGGTAVFAVEQFVAVLDGRTTKLCRSLDGNRYSIGEGPIPPLHMRCRSNRVLVLPEAIGGPLYDPGTYGNWIRRQPMVTRRLFMGARAQKVSDEQLASEAFVDYGAKPMTLAQMRNEARKVMASY